MMRRVFLSLADEPCGSAMSIDALSSFANDPETNSARMKFDSLVSPAVPARHTSPSPAAAELVIYECGTISPGLVHDPCQHSTVQVLCCTCAGCMFDLWSCGARPASDGWMWWEAQRMGMRWDPWVRHPYAMVVYALLVIFGFASHIIPDVLYVLMVVGALMAAVLAYGLHSALA